MYQYSLDINDLVDERFDAFYNEKTNNSSHQINYLFNNLTVSPPYEKDSSSCNAIVYFKEEITNDTEYIDECLLNIATPITSPLSEPYTFSIDETLSEKPTTAAETKIPLNLHEYHLNFVNYYKNAILCQTDSKTFKRSIESTLPGSYKQYLVSIKKSTCL